MPRSQPRPSPFRIGLYASASAIAAAAIVAWLFNLGSSEGGSVVPTGSGLRSSSPARDVFEQLYELGWRADGAAGNTAVTAVYYFPQLRTALSDYGERSFVQAQTLKTLETEDDPSTLPILIELESHESLPSDFAVSKHVAVSDDVGSAFSVVRWESLQDLSAPKKLIGLLWLRKVEGAAASNRLTLTLADIPGNIRPTTFSWNAAALELGNDSG